MATYGSYTYGHTVSLHYALPLLHRRPRRVGHRFDGGKFEPGFLHRITDRVVRSRDSAVEQRCFDEAGDEIAHLDPVRRPRSEARGVGKECVSTGRYRWSSFPSKKKMK